MDTNAKEMTLWHLTQDLTGHNENLRHQSVRLVGKMIYPTIATADGLDQRVLQIRDKKRKFTFQVLSG